MQLRIETLRDLLHVCKLYLASGSSVAFHWHLDTAQAT